MVWDYGGLKLSVLQCLHNRHRPDLDLWGNHTAPDDGCVRDVKVPADHPFVQPAGQGAMPVQKQIIN